jgi:hypothetical protein
LDQIFIDCFIKHEKVCFNEWCWGAEGKLKIWLTSGGKLINYMCSMFNDSFLN